MANDSRDRDIVLAPGEYAYVLDTTKGLVNTVVGPNKISMSNTDQPVVWDTKTKRFKRVDAESAIQLNSIAPEGFYIALYNPAEKPPQTGTISTSVPLQVGHRINLPGPEDRALWPGQMAEVIRGHHLRSNQYVLAQVYNDVAATENWRTAVVKPASQTPGETAQLAAPKVFTPGQLLIIKGTEVAFFIPPTGVKVVDDNGNYIREAVTLERLEYCILLDESGNKRFVQGPSVVFPEPTETFVTKDNQRKFRAIELNETSGLYIKVIADYEEEGQKYHAGDELFITGKEQAIYFQREEHSIIRYGDQTKHYAVAVPAGEGRYVLDRNTGEITLRRGPLMLLCDPRREVIVRRVLAPETVKLWYPNNAKVLEINAKLAEQEQRDSAAAYEAGRPLTTSVTPLRNAGMNAVYMAEEQAVRSRTVAGETFSRGTAFQPPRTITLDTKYEGAVGINLWTGYAVLVISKTGKRQVVVGPQNILLEYDETLAPLELSTGRPKADTNPFKTVYLRVSNNKVSDKISVETKDWVQLDLTVSYRVNFTGEETKWFAVEDYVKLLTDHLRSKIRNVAKRTTIEEFNRIAVDIIRDAILGAPVDGKRPGLTFEENSMHVYDIEVLATQITQSSVAKLLNEAQAASLQSTIDIAKKEFDLDITKRSETINRYLAELKAETAEQVAAARQRELASGLAVTMTTLQNEAKTADEQMKAKLSQTDQQALLSEKNLAMSKAADDAKIAYMQAQIHVELERLTGETEQVVKRAGAVGDKLADALSTLSDKAMVERIAVALAPIAAMQGVSAVDVLGKYFEGTPLKGVLDALGERAKLPLATAR